MSELHDSDSGLGVAEICTICAGLLVGLAKEVIEDGYLHTAVFQRQGNWKREEETRVVRVSM